MTRTSKILAIAAVGLIVACCALMLQPVCVPLDVAALASFNVPIEQRTDTDFYLTVFQKRDGQWHQCKTRLSRLLFF